MQGYGRTSSIQLQGTIFGRGGESIWWDSIFRFGKDFRTNFHYGKAAVTVGLP